jgi:hypothetical protein
MEGRCQTRHHRFPIILLVQFTVAFQLVLAQQVRQCYCCGNLAVCQEG